MGAVPGRCEGGEHNDKRPIVEGEGKKRRGSSRCSGDTVDCPICQGTGRMPRGQESELVAVIPCSDQRLTPRHTKLYVTVSVVGCLAVSSLVLFFLFPRSILLSPAAVKSSLVYFTEKEVQINITNVLNITNNNFVAVRSHSLNVQALKDQTVVGTISIRDFTSVQPLSHTTYSFVVPIKLTNGLSDYCRKAALPVRILFLHLQMTMTVFYLAHYEQLSLETYEYIDCGANSTMPHSVQPPPP